ncbi:MAG: VPLPA-CTERM sorting domain-containing protein [Pseudomonadota bacterium]
MRISAITASAVAFFGMATVGVASTLDVGNYGPCLGSASCTVGGFEVTANPAGAVLSEQDFRGLSGLGVDGPTDGSGSRDNEIQPYLSEFIDVSLTGFGDDGIGISEIVLGHLYNPDEFSSDPIEIATINATLFDDTLSVITISSDNNNPLGFSFLGDANVTRTSTFQGRFVITDLFSGQAVKELRFSGNNAPFGNDGTDYSLVSISVVPLPAAGWMLIAGIGGLAAMKRRKKS